MMQKATGNIRFIWVLPEYGKTEFLRRFTAEIERVKVHFPNAKTVGLADGAECNWQFLTPHIQTQILEFYHASSYLGVVANAKYPKDKSAHKAWLEDRCHQLKHTAGAAEALYNEMVALQARKGRHPKITATSTRKAGSSRDLL